MSETLATSVKADVVYAGEDFELPDGVTLRFGPKTAGYYRLDGRVYAFGCVKVAAGSDAVKSAGPLFPEAPEGFRPHPIEGGANSIPCATVYAYGGGAPSDHAAFLAYWEGQGWGLNGSAPWALAGTGNDPSAYLDPAKDHDVYLGSAISYLAEA